MKLPAGRTAPALPVYKCARLLILHEIEYKQAEGSKYMKKNSTSNEKAWNYAIGIVQVEGIKPAADFLELAEKEKRGELTNDDIRQVLVKKYTVVEDAVHA